MDEKVEEWRPGNQMACRCVGKWVESARAKQLFRVPFGWTLTTFQNGRSMVSFLPLVAFVALGVFSFLTLLAFFDIFGLFCLCQPHPR